MANDRGWIKCELCKAEFFIAKVHVGSDEAWDVTSWPWTKEQLEEFMTAHRYCVPRMALRYEVEDG